MKKVFLLAIATAFTFTACKDNKAEATPTDTAATEINADHEDHTGHNHGTETTAATSTTAAPTKQAAGNTTGAKLNPPHGEPGHRCEIPVGAPLDGSGSAAPKAQTQPANNSQGFLGSGNSQPQAQAQPQVQPTKQAAPAQQTAPGMQGKPNPAHGQPGHRCDVQVGQPLP